MINAKKTYIGTIMAAGLLLGGNPMRAAQKNINKMICVNDAIQKDNRPAASERLFRSQAVENEIVRIQQLLKNVKLA